MTKVSVIIPSYNRYEYLKNAVNSVINQTHKNIEIIIVNDGSTDQKYYSNELSYTILIHLKSNSSNIVGDRGKAAYTRNIGIKNATGDYIAFLDDDDIWMPDKIEKQLIKMKETNCEMSCTDGFIGNGVFNKEKAYSAYIDYHKDFLSKTKNINEYKQIWDKNFLMIHNCCVTSSVIISKNIIDKIGYMLHIRVGEDYEYWLRALDYTNCVFVNEPLFYYDNNHGDGALY